MRQYYLLIPWFVTLLSYPGAAAPVTPLEERVPLPRYEYRESDLTAGFDLQYGSVNYPNFEVAPNERLGQPGHSIHLALEWIATKSFGKLGMGGGVGYFLFPNFRASSGQFASLHTLPAEVFLSYRLDFFENQILVPFGKVGLSSTLAKQTSRTGLERSGTLLYWGMDWATGLELCLNNIDSSSVRILDSNFGINAVYLLVEYTNSDPLGPRTTPDLSHSEYRLGLRFEI